MSYSSFKYLPQRAESFTEITQGSNDSFTDFLQRLTTALSTATSDTTARKILIEFLASENANA